MRERVREQGGTLDVKSGSGGTMVNASFVIAGQEATADSDELSRNPSQSLESV
jgi:signal transduction histidine kinase